MNEDWKYLEQLAEKVDITPGMLGAGAHVWLSRHSLRYTSDESVICQIFRMMDAQRKIELGIK